MSLMSLKGICRLSAGLRLQTMLGLKRQLKRGKLIRAEQEANKVPINRNRLKQVHSRASCQINTVALGNIVPVAAERTTALRELLSNFLFGEVRNAKSNEA